MIVFQISSSRSSDEPETPFERDRIGRSREFCCERVQPIVLIAVYCFLIVHAGSLFHRTGLCITPLRCAVVRGQPSQIAIAW